MVDVGTVRSWLDRMGWSVRSVAGVTLVAESPLAADVPIFVRCAAHWLMLAVVPALPAGPRPADLPRRLLAVNRDMRLAKFGFDEDGDVILAAELPTESLDFAEVEDALARLVRYARHYRGYLTTP